MCQLGHWDSITAQSNAVRRTVTVACVLIDVCKQMQTQHELHTTRHPELHNNPTSHSGWWVSQYLGKQDRTCHSRCPPQLFDLSKNSCLGLNLLYLLWL